MADRNLPPAEEFVNALESSAHEFGVKLSDASATLLLDYFRIVADWNARLHLVAPCPPAEFATRHVLESLLALPHIPEGSRLVDVGSGAGLPAVPCLIARPDLSAILVESSAKKGVFLREALRKVERHDRARVVVERFEKAARPEAEVLTCRALERFTELLPRLVEWSSKVKTLLLFGGPTLRAEIERAGLEFAAERAPRSEQRYLFIIDRRDTKTEAG